MTDTTHVPWHDGTTRQAQIGVPFRCTHLGGLHYVRPHGWSRTPDGPVVSWEDCAVAAILTDAPDPPAPRVEVPLTWTWAFVSLGRRTDAEDPAPSVVQVQGTYSDGIWMRHTGDGQGRRLEHSERVVRLIPELEL